MKKNRIYNSGLVVEMSWTGYLFWSWRKQNVNVAINFLCFFGQNPMSGIFQVSILSKEIRPLVDRVGVELAKSWSEKRKIRLFLQVKEALCSHVLRIPM